MGAQGIELSTQPTLSPRLPPSTLLCHAEARCSDHPGPFWPEKLIISDRAIPQAWLTAAVRSTSFRLLRMKQASPLSILQTESSNPMNCMGQQSRASAHSSQDAASPLQDPSGDMQGCPSSCIWADITGDPPLQLQSLWAAQQPAGPAVLWMRSTSLCSLGSHEVLVLQRRALEVDHSLRPQRDLQDPPHLDVHLCWAKYHHVVILEEREVCMGQQAGGPTQTCRSELRNGVLLPDRTGPLGLLIVVTMCDTPCPCFTALARVLENTSVASPRCSA